MNSIRMRFTAQHQEIIVLCERLKLMAKEKQLVLDTSIVKELQDELSNTLRQHLHLEDLVLYPSLKESKNPEISEISKRLEKEMVEISHEYSLYKEKYFEIKSIKKDISQYEEDTKFMVNKLLDRIDKEETQLYCLL